MGGSGVSGASSRAADGGTVRADGCEKLWAIACYFNPLGSRRRIANFRTFARRLEAPLLAIELSFDGHFDLTDADADVLLQIRGGDLLWQKERLLNLAVAALPAECEQVAWLDGDVVFLQRDWAQRVSKALEGNALVQVFERVFEPGPLDLCDDPLQAVDGVPYRGALTAGLCEGRYDLRVLDRIGSGTRLGYSMGHGWAAHRELLAECGLYDTLVLGTGDKAMAAAAFGRVEGLIRSIGLSPGHADHLRAWAAPFTRAVAGAVGYCENTIVHLWHGDLANRRYATRYDDFERFAFDPRADLRIAESGAWCWSSAKAPMHAYVRRYFEERREDGVAAYRHAGAGA